MSTVLVIDDEKIALDLVKLALTKFGHDFDRVLPKPFSLQSLIDAVHNLTNQRVPALQHS